MKVIETQVYERNFAYITCLETIFVTWFCYLALLFIYDETILGDRHPVTYAIFFFNTIWAFYLLSRLLQMWKVTTAVRYSIPTAIIAFSSYEIAAFLAVRTPAHAKREQNA